MIGWTVNQSVRRQSLFTLWAKWFIAPGAMIDVPYFAGKVFPVDARPEPNMVIFGAVLVVLGLVITIGRKALVEGRMHQIELSRRALRLKDASYARYDESMIKGGSIFFLIFGIILMSLGFYFIIDSL